LPKQATFFCCYKNFLSSVEVNFIAKSGYFFLIKNCTIFELFMQQNE